MEKKYILNLNTKTLHLKDGCYHARGLEKCESKQYYTEDGVIEENKNYFKKCKLCFEGK